MKKHSVLKNHKKVEGKKQDNELVLEKFAKTSLKYSAELKFKKFIGLYRNPRFSKIQKEILKTEKKVLNVGSGMSRIGKNVINLDMQKYPNVDIVCDVCKRIDLPDNSVDAIIIEAVIQFLHDPDTAMKEMNRVLRKGGIILSVTAFMFKYNPCPRDYQRLTLDGLDKLHEKYNFKKIEAGPMIGPTSTLRHVLANYMTLFTFTTNEWVNDIMRSLVFIITWPIKYLDIFFYKSSKSKYIAGSYYYYARKV